MKGTHLNVAALRRQARERAASRRTVPFDGAITDLSVAGVPVRRYRPSALPRFPTTVSFLHGGYGLFGDLDLQDRSCRVLATRIGHIVVSIDYPLAPENTFGAAVGAVEGVLRALDSSPRILGGDSAGGALALAVARRRLRSGIRINGMVLTNPNLDLTLSSLDSTAPSGPDAPLLAHAMSLWLGDNRPRLDLDVAGLPPTLTAVGTLDSLAREAHSFHSTCLHAGVPSRLLELDGVGHGFLSDTAIASRVADEARAFFDLGQRL